MRFLGIDTSNYMTSAAVYDSETDTARSITTPLPVKRGELGLRQSDALFNHVKRLPDVLKELDLSAVRGIGVSDKPRPAEGSYMPCFLAGVSAAETLAHALNVPLHRFSHQEGHIAAAAWSAGRPELLNGEFYAWHLSGGTTEFVKWSPNIDISNIAPCRGGYQPSAGDQWSPLHEKPHIEIIAATKDISAGQLIDRAGLLLGLPFPAGDALDKLAIKHDRIIPVKVASPNLSGFENKVQALIAAGEKLENIAYFVMNVIIQFVINNTPDGVPLLFAGGVARSQVLRENLPLRLNNIYFAAPEYSGDNAAGVAYLAFRKANK
ncbi:MAG: DNA-binding protein [Oscillospiraceae bacterium]|nr:DNA-binding protein [Oscillospiraceae bacterium]